MIPELYIYIKNCYYYYYITIGCEQRDKRIIFIHYVTLWVWMIKQQAYPWWQEEIQEAIENVLVWLVAKTKSLQKLMSQSHYLHHSNIRVLKTDKSKCKVTSRHFTLKETKHTIYGICLKLSCCFILLLWVYLATI